MEIPFFEKAGSNTQLTVYSVLVVISILAAVASEFYFLAAVPFALLLVYMSVVDFRAVFFLLMVCLPISSEVNLPGGFGTDLPSEPLMVGLALIYLFYVLKNGKNMSGAFVKHPLTLLFLLYIGWIFLTTITSGLFFVSFKFLLAKLWYVTVFYFMAGTIFQKEKDYKIYFWSIFIPLITTVLIIVYRHSSFDFAFDKINAVVQPFYRNHVNYACLMALFFPVVWLAVSWYRRRSLAWWVLVLGGVVILVGINYAYTRAAYVAIVLALGAFFIIRLRLMKIAIAVTAIGAVLLLAHLSSNNKYLDYRPDFNKTITHNDFGNLLEATAKGEDISTMERVYRWVAGFQMIKERPVVGYGPGNFINFYEKYTVSGFRTYVSDNPERSGIHSYYFMVMVEQGIPGVLIFLLLTAFILIKGEEVYHQTLDIDARRIVLMAILSIVVIDSLLLINDMLETDKVGPFYFMGMAWIVNQDLRNQKKLKPSD